MRQMDAPPAELREDREWTELSQQWLDVHRKPKELEKEEKSLRALLIDLAETKDTTGGGIRLTCSLRKGMIQYQQIPELKDVDLELYRKAPIEVWRLIPKETP